MSAGPVCRIVADSFERRSGVVEALRELRVFVEIRALPCGDYEVAPGVLVERKTVSDLHLSLQRGRLWRQVGDLVRASDRPHLLIEGLDLDAGSIAPNAIRGACLAMTERRIVVLRSLNAVDSARWLRLLALRAVPRRPRHRPVYAQRLKPRDPPAEAALASVPGISVENAKALLVRFGSVAGVVAAGPSEWMSIKGIGPERAHALARALL
jgi:ERCC4-type nuclease